MFLFVDTFGCQPQSRLAKPAELISLYACMQEVSGSQTDLRNEPEPVLELKVHEGGTQADCQNSRQRRQSMQRETVRMR
jgi:hypothetical protein